MIKHKQIVLSVLVGLAVVGCDDGDGPQTDMGTPPSDTGVDETCPVAGDVVIDADISEDTTWDCDNYLLQGKIFVTNNATLTIAAGTQIFGDTAGSETAALIVTRGAQLQAVGTAAEPIVFTSGNASPDRATGDWAGVALMGSASINQGADIGGGVLQGNLEGIDPTDARSQYGGDDDASDCGTLQYVRIEFAGAEFSPDNELNGLTIAGCGTGTDLSYIQVHRGKDDGIEFFGGTAGMDHVVISGASDDSLDWDLGWRGDVQFLVVHQFEGIGDNGFEADSNGSNETAGPRSDPRLYNVTMIGTTTTRGMVLREGTLGELRNFIVTGFGSEPLDLRAVSVDLSTEWPSQLSIENSFFHNNGAYTDETATTDNDDGGVVEQTLIEAAERNNTTDTDPGIGSASVTAPDYVPSSTALAGQAVPPFGDTTATYAGAFAPNATSDWSAGWTAFPTN